MEQEGTKKITYVIAAIGGLMFLLGLGVLLYPSISSFFSPTTVVTPTTPTTPVTPTTPTTNTECKYDDFALKVKTPDSDLLDSLSIKVGESFRVYLYENTDTKEEINDVNILAEGAGIDQVVESGDRIEPDEAGTLNIEASYPNCGTVDTSITVLKADQFAGGVGKVCGQGCSTNADCAAATTGVAVECHQGKCVNSACKANTVYGNRCDCNLATKACGAPCSGAIGLCGAGSSCTYISGPSCTDNPDPANPTRTYCVPSSGLPAGYTRENCVARDQGNRYLKVPTGTTITQALITQLCGGSGRLPATAIELDSLNPVAFAGVGLILFGIIVVIKYRRSKSNG